MADANSKISYGRLMHEAVCGVIRTVLRQVSDTGLPGDHHFFITFATDHPGSEIADWLRDRYPEEMMIVIQNWFDDLVVEEDAFSITLNFGDAPERLTVPFDAILTFVDPSVEFGWRFERAEDEEEGEEEDQVPASADSDTSTPEPAPEPEEASDPSRAKGDAEVVSLDRFRRK